MRRGAAVVAMASAALVSVALSGCGTTSEASSSSAAPTPSPSTSAAPAVVDASAEFEELEARFDARLGVMAIQIGSLGAAPDPENGSGSDATGGIVEWRADERFAYASTIKALAAGAALDLLGVDGTQATVTVSADDLVTYSPVVETRVGGSMTLADVADAALTVSDNTAGNYLFDAVGGPDELDRLLAEAGGEATTVSRIEPELNEATPGDDRDTSTPRAMADTLREYVLGDILPAAERAQLVGWMTATETGDTLVRADLPSEWVVGDKSGSGGYGTRNDIAVVWPTDGAPIVIAVMSSRGAADAARDDRLIAEAAAVAVHALGAMD
ncbi:class A beta-lactamase [Marisediminicola sp. LYQ134]|uniref:class A beta-lactamase n=1 Tax=Marisediminicola sp. LYQ134 TaxID=3391061 RepID=UPI0039835597